MQRPWQIYSADPAPPDFIEAVKQLHPEAGAITAQLLWQRGYRDSLRQVPPFLDWRYYESASPLEFPEMSAALGRLQQALDQQEKVVIWGDFDTDGVTATAVLWEGLKPLLGTQLVDFYIPNRHHDSHGLSPHGLQQLQQKGVALIITCDTGSTNGPEIVLARQLGMDVIVTDHHTLDPTPLGAVALINPRQLPWDHPLRHLSGVGVAYKFLEAVYDRWPEKTQGYPLENLLDLVAIGLIADWVELRGECRYLAQRGLDQLGKRQTLRPGIAALLGHVSKHRAWQREISFTVAPRLNAVSRVEGDVRPLITLLTTQDRHEARQLAERIATLNTERQRRQKEVTRMAHAKAAQLDLSASRVILLTDDNWPLSLLGLVANDIVKTYGRPALLLQTNPETGMAVGSARSDGSVDLYEAFHSQRHLLEGLGGHPYAVGFRLKMAHIPLLAAALNQFLAQQEGTASATPKPLVIDLEVTLGQLNGQLLKELEVLAPFDSTHHPYPRLLVRNVELTQLRDNNSHGGRRYVSMVLHDRQHQHTFPAKWWDHQIGDCPQGACDLVIELEQWQSSLSAVIKELRPSETNVIQEASFQPLMDYRDRPPAASVKGLRVETCPTSRQSWRQWIQRAKREQQPLILAYAPPPEQDALKVWREFLTLCQQATQQGKPLEREGLQKRLGIEATTLNYALQVLETLGVKVLSTPEEFWCQWPPQLSSSPPTGLALERFTAAIAEENFRRRYFAAAPLQALQETY
ncbi:single-stranded-DNA-specific exonuclease RecJ [Thermosynechococcus vestitus]|uniref:Single-strand-DNA-specific exonuclease n=1 Tax=Thermosynechococcus vestitus (strain NIES-2133 / IAM M-273 / BP-1) TaxID=197221 RepID=Q8DME4_THEVB|nr:single-stranded-DNA-specific exonuclease RecJ [Thermosynechococcus vestitus]BAC07727.1 single-strand-DNA-specific exonuclease [Thermosynechococcus vestitus BP-1]